MRFVVTAILVFYSVPSIAQSIRAVDLEHYNDCIAQSNSTNSSKMRHGVITYACGGNVAKSWFDDLDGDSIRNLKGGGQAVVKNFGSSGNCFHQISNADGTGANRYICNISGPAPD